MEGKKNQKPESKQLSDSPSKQPHGQQQKRPLPPFKFDREGWEKDKQKMSEAELRMVEAFNL